MPTQAEVGGMLSPALNAEDRQEPPEARRGEAWVDSPAHTSSQTSSLQNWEERACSCVNCQVCGNAFLQPQEVTLAAPQVAPMKSSGTQLRDPTRF